MLILSLSFGHMAILCAVTTHLVVFAVFVRFVWEFRPFVASFLVASMISTVFTMLTLVLPLVLLFGFRLVPVVTSSIEPSAKGLNCLLEFGREGFCFR